MNLPCLYSAPTNRIPLSSVQTCAVRPFRLFLPTNSERDETRGPDSDSLVPHYSPGYHVAPHYSSELGQIQENQHPLSDFPSYVYSPIGSFENRSSGSFAIASPPSSFFTLCHLHVDIIEPKGVKEINQPAPVFFSSSLFCRSSPEQNGGHYRYSLPSFSQAHSRGDYGASSFSSSAAFMQSCA